MSEELKLHHTATVWEDVPHKCIVCDSMDADFCITQNYESKEACPDIWMCHHHVWDFILAQAKKERARLGIKTEVEK